MSSVPTTLAAFRGEELWRRSAPRRTRRACPYEFLRSRATPASRLETLEATSIACRRTCLWQTL
ncbi:MAG: hypothetical protein R2712_14605 [Vicinamibacterales bacterium]